MKTNQITIFSKREINFKILKIFLYITIQGINRICVFFIINTSPCMRYSMSDKIIWRISRRLLMGYIFDIINKWVRVSSKVKDIVCIII